MIKPFILFIDWFNNTPALPFNVKKARTILITEYHRIGDVVMLIPALDMIKKTFPLSRIIEGFHLVKQAKESIKIVVNPD